MRSERARFGCLVQTAVFGPVLSGAGCKRSSRFVSKFPHLACSLRSQQKAMLHPPEPLPAGLSTWAMASGPSTLRTYMPCSLQRAAALPAAARVALRGDSCRFGRGARNPSW
eukprot:9639710-Lingulodinium_polyedra.AAC.1